jgi:hypothetical protein
MLDLGTTYSNIEGHSSLLAILALFFPCADGVYSGGLIYDKEKRKQRAIERTKEAIAFLESLGKTLHHTLSIDDTINWESLKNMTPFAKIPPLKRAVTPPMPASIPSAPVITDQKYQPKLGILGKIFPQVLCRSLQGTPHSDCRPTPHTLISPSSPRRFARDIGEECSAQRALRFQQITSLSLRNAWLFKNSPTPPSLCV